MSEPRLAADGRPMGGDPMTGGYDDQWIESNPHGWVWHWTRPNGSPGGVIVERWASIRGKGVALGIRGVGRQSPELQVWVSDAGRSIQVFLDGKRMAANLADDIAAALNTAQQPGRWVPWCVAHETAQDHKAPEDASCPEGWDAVGWLMDAPVAEDCRWHPQGAFIPDDEGGTT